ncbi:MAG: ATP-binding protein, partial [Anaerolineae bacterium]|nr:ATP-binding protein [Anaerolineae bacterium]
INNAKKYANASKIELVLSAHSNEDELTVVIKDDGNGFDVSKMKEGYDERGSLGMINMQERASGVNGILEIMSTEGTGTKIILKLPLTGNYLKGTSA